VQVLVRETTRATENDGAPGAAIVTGNQVVALASRKIVLCPFLQPDVSYVGYNGNGNRKGQGYRIASPGGWLAKAGYHLEDVDGFFGDLADLSAPLGLIITGFDPSSKTFRSWTEMQALAQSGPGRRDLSRLHLRVYSRSDYLERWNNFFGWTGFNPLAEAVNPAVELVTIMKAKGISQRQLAIAIQVDPAFLNKVLQGCKPWPAGLAARAKAHVESFIPAILPVTQAAETQSEMAPTSTLEAALAYLERGWSVVPQRKGAKKPCVRWKRFQQDLPTEDEIRRWWAQWPDAGIALILGPVSRLFVIDVDGIDAHLELIGRLGSEPIVAKVLSGSGDPFRYHLYFLHPSIRTKSKFTPWHPKLEFRGLGGIVIAPPSVHRSGKCYQWAVGRSVDDMPLSAAPAQVLAALEAGAAPKRKCRTAATEYRPVAECSGFAASASTQEFLAGKFAEGPGWNKRLFHAACDLAGRQIPIEEAQPALLAGARPWDQNEEANAIRTIESAYGQPREPGRI
jgi:hypothetical protein